MYFLSEVLFRIALTLPPPVPNPGASLPIPPSKIHIVLFWKSIYNDLKDVFRSLLLLYLGADGEGGHI